MKRNYKFNKRNRFSSAPSFLPSLHVSGISVLLLDATLLWISQGPSTWLFSNIFAAKNITKYICTVRKSMLFSSHVTLLWINGHILMGNLTYKCVQAFTSKHVWITISKDVPLCHWPWKPRSKVFQNTVDNYYLFVQKNTWLLIPIKYW